LSIKVFTNLDHIHENVMGGGGLTLVIH